jgi:hypothetical protein
MKKQKSIVINGLDSIDEPDPPTSVETSSNMLGRGKFLCGHDETVITCSNNTFTEMDVVLVNNI